MNNYIILHGSFGSKDGNWFPWLKEQLEEKNLKVDVPQMPVGVGSQNFDNWSDELNKLSIEFSRYKERWDKLAKNVKSVNASIDELQITSDKITKKFDNINNVDIDLLVSSSGKDNK